MKKIILSLMTIILSFFTILNVVGCKKTSYLLPYVSELRADVFEGSFSSFTIKAYYGYRETPYINDGKVGNYSHQLTFILQGANTEETAFTLEIFDYKEVVNFEKTPSGKLVARLNVDDFDKKEFDVALGYSSQKIQITMCSLLPEETLDVNEVLLNIEQTQTNLLNSFSPSGVFQGEIYARIIVKNQKPYWYIALANGKTLKAFLVDGLTGEVLAIREVI